MRNNPNIEFIDFSNNPITHYGLQQFITTHPDIVSTNFSGCPIDTNRPNLILDIPVTIHQTPFINCTFGNANLLTQRTDDAKAMMNVLYNMLESFNLNSPEERQALIKFIFSPRAQKALKWLSQNSEEQDLQVVGEQFVFLLNRMAQENIFYLKAICKELNDGSFFFNIPQEAFFDILSYLDLKDIVLSATDTGPVVEEVQALGLFQSTDGDDDLYS